MSPSANFAPLRENLFFSSTNDGLTNLIRHLSKQIAAGNKIFFLTDTNTSRHCLPLIKKHFKNFGEIKIAAGENHKTIATCNYIWQKLLDYNASRSSVLVNLGGGVITDIGGFAASCFKRGIIFINVPTTLMAMTDAAIGGKTGINFGGLKNQVGVFAQPENIFIYPPFLKTLSKRHFKSGLAEIYKHALIANKKLLNKLTDTRHPTPIIRQSVKIKSAIVKKDFYDNKQRQVLNFGHTIGHALEACLNSGKETNVLHGEAVAAGMIMELYLSHKKLNFPKKALTKISSELKNKLSIPSLKTLNRKKFFSALAADKKNKSGKITFTLLRKIGKPVINCHCSDAEIKSAFNYYLLLTDD